MHNIFYMLAVVLLLFASCKRKETLPDPRACFEVDKSLYKAGETIRFNNCSENFDRVEWNFRNGQVSTELNPTFSWDTKGPHLVTLTVYNKNGSSEVSRNIRVADSTYAGFRAIFSNWVNNYRDSIFTFSVYSLQNGYQTKLFQSTQSGNSMGGLIEAEVKVPDANEEFRIKLTMLTSGGNADSLITESFSVTDAVGNIPALSSQLKFVRVEHEFTLFYK
ncbi:MAG TPA: PKD domain-containing protein [Bacteroidia bacterium]|nr:PKD domain-containing protein [Bacteroidia bacterium]